MLSFYGILRIAFFDCRYNQQDYVSIQKIKTNINNDHDLSRDSFNNKTSLVFPIFTKLK